MIDISIFLFTLAIIALVLALLIPILKLNERTIETMTKLNNYEQGLAEFKTRYVANLNELKETDYKIHMRMDKQDKEFLHLKDTIENNKK